RIRIRSGLWFFTQQIDRRLVRIRVASPRQSCETGRSQRNRSRRSVAPGGFQQIYSIPTIANGSKAFGSLPNSSTCLESTPRPDTCSTLRKPRANLAPAETPTRRRVQSFLEERCGSGISGWTHPSLDGPFHLGSVARSNPRPLTCESLEPSLMKQLFLQRFRAF